MPARIINSFSTFELSKNQPGFGLHSLDKKIIMMGMLHSTSASALIWPGVKVPIWIGKVKMPRIMHTS